MIILYILLALQVKHFVADFVLQTPEQAVKKGIYGHWQGILHALNHGIFTGAILLEAGIGPMSSLLAALFDFIVHYHMDWFKVYTCKKQGYTPTTHKRYWIWMGFDQMIHQITYLVILMGLFS